MADFASAVAALKADFEQGIPAFSMEYVEASGRRWGANAEWETRLTVTGRGGLSLFRRRGPDDGVVEPPGSYSHQLSDTALQGLLTCLESSGIDSYHTDAPGPREPANMLTVVIRGKVFQFHWGFSLAPTPKGMSDLKILLTNWTIGPFATINWSLNLTARILESGKGALRANLKLENSGLQRIHIVNPASPGLGPNFGIHLSYGEPQMIEEGYTPDPVEMKSAPLKVITLDRVETIEIPPGGGYDIDFSTVLEGQAPRGRVGKFEFLHYLQDDFIAGIRVFNGAVFSEEFSW